MSLEKDITQIKEAFKKINELKVTDQTIEHLVRDGLDAEAKSICIKYGNYTKAEADSYIASIRKSLNKERLLRE